jgi:guanosine-3',5'-bis(diphosphate) 3'-pyrophosphohydrolase
LNLLEEIKEFAAKAHGSQVRKFTSEPYINHPVRVMEICNGYTDKVSILAAALLHDVLEDTPVSEPEMNVFLKSLMPQSEAAQTLQLVIDLTDIFIKEDFPKLNRKVRKKKERERMSQIHPDAQTVKYADIIDNAKDVTKSNKGFAPKFLKEVKELLTVMREGHPELYAEALKTVNSCLSELK